MTIDKAINELEDGLRPLRGYLHKDYNAAIQLGIEALKRVQDMRKSPCTTADEYLPGEPVKQKEEEIK